MRISTATHPGRFSFTHRVLLVLLVSLAPRAHAEKHEFVFEALNLPTRPERVHLAGSFNGWSKDATPMAEDGGKFKATVDLDEGV